MQVVVPSVSLAAVPQGTALTVFVETPSSATTSRPVWLAGCNGPPCSGTTLGFAGVPIAGGANPRVEGGGLPVTVPVVCWASPANGSMVTATAAIRVILRIEASLWMQQ
jgi:hypothetical protein